eukprot:GEMP01017398.1.p1 GENE.GEMP01017398.1~~GEMP01017398.1.p1  ORF type:complete len:733 (+),score=124.53 GEMP01017398.1:109-2307(+)
MTHALWLLASFLVAWSGIVPECGPEMTHTLAEIPFYPDPKTNYTVFKPCVHLWPSGGFKQSLRPQIGKATIITEESQSESRLKFSIPPLSGAYMWYVWQGKCSRPSGGPALIQPPGMGITSYPFHLYRQYAKIESTPSVIGLSSDKPLRLRAKFPYFESPCIKVKVWFLGEKHNKTKNARVILPGKEIEVEAPTWPLAETVVLRITWCGGGALSQGQGHLRFTSEESLFGEVAANVNEEHLGDDEGDSKPHHVDKTVSMVETSEHTFFDPEHNEFVKTRSGDRTKLDIDMRFMKGVLLLISSASVCGFLASAIHPDVPASIGYIVGGILVGPGGFDVIEELIQVETFASFGVVFMLFELGMHFSLQKIMAARRAALGGGLLLTTVLLVSNIGISLLTGTKVLEGLLFGIFASLSSTALTSQVSSEPNLVAVLIVQDVLLALFLACVPALLGVHSGTDHEKWAPYAIVFFIALLGIKVFAEVLRSCFQWRSTRTLSPEVGQALMIAWMMSLSYCCEVLGFSLELGAFFAGFTLPIRVENSDSMIVPLRRFFGVLFFGSIGLVVYPLFLWDNTFAVVTVSLWLLISKLFIGAACLISCGVSKKDSMVLSLRLAHVGEFGFLFASKGRSWGILSRHVYLLLVGATACSIASAPILFKFAEKEFNFLDIGVQQGRYMDGSSTEMKQIRVRSKRRKETLKNGASKLCDSRRGSRNSFTSSDSFTVAELLGIPSDNRD